MRRQAAALWLLLCPLTARAGMDGPAQAPAGAPWACHVEWNDIREYDAGNTHYTSTQYATGSGFLMAPGIVLTARHVVPGFTPSEGLTVRCGDQVSSGRTWTWLNPADAVAAISYANQPMVSASPNDLAVIFLQAPFDVDAASLPRLPRDTSEVDAAVRGGNCAAWGWAGGDLHGHQVTPLEDKRGLPGDPKIGPSPWHGDSTHVLEYPNPVTEGDSGGPVVCLTAGGDRILAGLVEGISPNRAVAIYQRVDPYLPFLCAQDADYCAKNSIGPQAADSAKAAGALDKAKTDAGRLTGN